MAEQHTPEPQVPEPDERTWAERAATTPDRVPPPRWVVPVATLAAGLLCSLVAVATGGGGEGLAAGLVAAAVVLLFASTSAVPVRIAEDLGAGAGLSLALLLLNYASRLGVALLACAAAVGLGGLDRQALGISVVVCALVRVNLAVALLGRVRGT